MKTPHVTAAVCAFALLACGGQADEGEWKQIATVQLTQSDSCWQIDGPNMATSDLDATSADVTPGPKVWPSGAHVVIWARDDSASVDTLNHTPVNCE